MQNNQMTEDMMMVTSMACSDLQRQVNMLQTLPSNPVPAPRLNLDDDLLSVDMLPPPKSYPKSEGTRNCFSKSFQPRRGGRNGRSNCHKILCFREIIISFLFKLIRKLKRTLNYHFKSKSKFKSNNAKLDERFLKQNML